MQADLASATSTRSPLSLEKQSCKTRVELYTPYILDMRAEAVTRHLRLDGNQPRPGYVVHKRSKAIRCAQPNETDDSSEMMAAISPVFKLSW
jgi:hypothetical protein